MNILVPGALILLALLSKKSAAATVMPETGGSTASVFPGGSGSGIAPPSTEVSNAITYGSPAFAPVNVASPAPTAPLTILASPPVQAGPYPLTILASPPVQAGPYPVNVASPAPTAPVTVIASAPAIPSYSGGGGSMTVNSSPVSKGGGPGTLLKQV